ncbi:DUF2059 domain-containing protein [Rariglobus hedericola]|nr:DUF2059 domain-containing protein [Rariglobus hedericola]
MLATGTDRRFALAIPGGDTAWIGVGGKFSGWTLSEYRAAQDAIVLVKDGRETVLKLSSSTIGAADTKATLADAEEVLNKMKFEEMFGKIIEQQKRSVIEMTKSMTGKMKGADSADVAEFQAKVMDMIFAEMKPEEMKIEIAQIYSDVFTKSELKGLGDFYGTPAGQAMIDKQPDVQKKTMEVMMPRMMAGMAKIGPMTAEFTKQQAAKKKAAAAEAAAQATPVVSP